MYWQYAEAKSRFSEVFRKALSNGPQRITEGNESVIVIFEEQYQQLLGVMPFFDDYLKSTPSSEGLNLKRDQSLARATEITSMTLEEVIKHT